MARLGLGLMDEDSLFFTLAEDLKTPLLRIAYKAELAEPLGTAASDIRHTAMQTLQLLDAYLLSASSQTEFALEPVNPSAVLVDAAHELSVLARKRDCSLEISAPHHGMLALVHRTALLNAVTALGTVFIEAQSTLAAQHKRVELATYRTASGIAIGVFQPGARELIDAELLSRARAHVGAAARPFAGFASGASAQLFVAEQLLLRMKANLRAARRGDLSGLAADLQVSEQIQLV